MPLCKHTHSCLSALLIWHNEETQGHHSCFLSFWLSPDIRHHKASSVETDTVRISLIFHQRLVLMLATLAAWKGKSNFLFPDTQTKVGVVLLQRGSPCQLEPDQPETLFFFSSVNGGVLISLLHILPPKRKICGIPVFFLSFPKIWSYDTVCFCTHGVDAWPFSRQDRAAINRSDILHKNQLCTVERWYTEKEFIKIKNEVDVSASSSGNVPIFLGVGGWPMYVWQIFDWHLA